MTSQEASGSFMQVSDVIKFFVVNELPLEWLWKFIDEIDNISYLPTSVIESKLPPLEWKMMECVVSTHVFGLKSILTRDLPEVELEDGITSTQKRKLNQEFI